MSEELIYGLARPHLPGSICGIVCEQCGGEAVMSGIGETGELDECVPLFIIRPATYEEYVANVRAHGGGSNLSDPSERYYYFVSTD